MMIEIQPLGESYSWRGKRYLRGCTRIPEDLAIALGLLPTQSGTPDKSATDAQSVVDLPDKPPALELLNSGNAAEIATLPSIGKGAAKRIFDKRPEGGYESLEQAIALNPEVTQSPYRVDWEQVRDWEG